MRLEGKGFSGCLIRVCGGVGRETSAILTSGRSEITSWSDMSVNLVEVTGSSAPGTLFTYV